MKEDRIFHPRFIFICMIGFLFGIAAIMIGSTIALFIKSLGGSNGFTGTITTVASVTGIFILPLSGILSDKFGRRIVMIVGNVVYALICLCYVIVPSLLVVPPLRVIQMLGLNVFNATVVAAIADVIPHNKLGEAMGYYFIGQAVSQAFGPSIGLSLIRGNDFSMLYLVAMAILLLCVPIVFFVIPRRVAKPETARALTEQTVPSQRGIWRVAEKSALKPSAIELIFAFAIAGLSFATVFGTTQKFSNTGLYFVFSAITMTASRMCVGKLTNKAGALRIIVPSLVLLALSLVVISIFPVSAVFLVLGGISGLFTGVSIPILNSLALKDAPADRRGKASSVFNISTTMGRGLGSMVWGFTIDIGGFSTMFMGSAVVLLLGMVACFFLLKRKNQAQESEKPAA